MLANIGGRRNAKTITNKQEKIGPTGNANVTRTAATFHGPISADVPLVRSDVIHFLLTLGPDSRLFVMLGHGKRRGSVHQQQ